MQKDIYLKIWWIHSFWLTDNIQFFYWFFISDSSNFWTFYRSLPSIIPAILLLSLLIFLHQALFINALIFLFTTNNCCLIFNTISRALRLTFYIKLHSNFFVKASADHTNHHAPSMVSFFSFFINAVKGLLLVKH